MNNKFFYYYLAAHLVVFSLLLGLVADAFTVLSGGGISVPPTADSRAVVSNGVINGVIANATTTAYLKQAKRVAGGCEMWESTDFFRINRWGWATSSPNPTSSMTCNCPTGFTKIQIRSRQEQIADFRTGNWYNRWTNFTGSYGSPTLCSINFNPASAHTGVNSCYYGLYSSEPGYNKFCVKSLCNFGCDCSKTQPCDDQQQQSRANFFDFVFKTQLAKADDDNGGCSMGGQPIGCGMVSMCQYNPVSVSQTTTITTWLCVNTSTSATVTGWED